MEYKKNDILTVKIEDIGNEGEGIGKVDGFTLFIKDAILGDTVTAKIMKAKKNYAYAHLESIVEPSEYRVEPKCDFYKQCGGCQLQPLSYEKQLEYKQKKITNNLVRIGGFDKDFVDEVMEPIIGMDNPFEYRNKAQFPFGRDKNNEVITGFYAGHSHNIIANTDCKLGSKVNKEILEIILEHVKSNNITTYNEETNTGLLRHVLIRIGNTSGEVMVCLILNRILTKEDRKKLSRFNDGFEFISKQSSLIEKLCKVDGMASISVNINNEKTNVIMGREIFTIWGKNTIKDTIHVRDMKKEGYPFTGQKLEFNISPLSFYQVNPVQTEKLYSLALEYADLSGEESVWDLYCGIGTISLFMSEKAGCVYGVEIIPEAIENARENARLNKASNTRFFVGKAEEILPEFYKEVCNKESRMLHPDVIVVDPPRKGCDEECLATMIKMQPERIVYVSCDSATLARDLNFLCNNGYVLKKVRGVDQFGQTSHVETVVLLSKAN